VTNWKNVCVVCFIQSLSSRLEKATVAPYFGRALSRLGVDDFLVFRLLSWLFPS